MTLDVEDVVECTVGGNEPLGLTLGLKPLHFPLPSSDREVRVFHPIVVAQPSGFVTLQTTQISQGSFVGSEAIGDDFVRHVALVLEQFSQQFQCCCLVAALLHEDVEDLAFLIHRPPHEHANTIDAHDHFIEMPDAVGRLAALADVGGDRRTELVGPASYGLICDVDPAFGEHFFDVAQARGEAEIEPHRKADRVGRKPVALEG